MPLIPEHRLVNWTIGDVDGCGVEGGIDQYRPGGINERLTVDMIDVTQAPYSADRTGLGGDASAAIASAIAAITTQKGVYLPTGVYRSTGGIRPGYKDNYTIRGDGQFTASFTGHEIGTGTKAFEVPSGLNYTPGCGVWVWPWDRWNIKISSLTRSGSTATATTTSPHGYTNGQLVEIRGADQAAYNAGHIITVTSETTFTFSVVGAPASPATGSWIYTQTGLNTAIVSITRVGTTATVTTLHPHGLFAGAGEIVYLDGADQPEYNGYITPTVTSPTTFTYTVSGSPATPATGTMRVGIAYHGGPNYTMMGTCVSYSDTTLTLDIDSVRAGTGSKFGMWKVSQTLIVNEAPGSPCIYIGGDNIQDMQDANRWHTPSFFPEIQGSPSAGDDELTLNDASGITVGDLVQVGIKNNFDPNQGEAGDNAMIVDVKGYNYSLRQMTKCVGKAGSVVTIEPALLFDLPSGLVPKIINTSSYASKVGVEDLAMMAETGSSSNLFAFVQTMDCWAYRVSCHMAISAQLGAGVTLRTEYRECWSSHRNIPGPGGKGLGASQCSGLLVVDSVMYESAPAVEVNSSCHWAFVNNCILHGDLNTDHGAHVKFGLVEHNLCLSTIVDGYWGGADMITYLRNYFPGYNYYYVSLWQLRHSRLVYNNNVVGNIFGTPGYNDGSLYLGYPNMGNQDFNDNVEATAGNYWRHLTNTGGIVATLTTRTSDSVGTITLSALTTADLQPPNRYDGDDFINLWWGPDPGTQLRFNANITGGAGNTITFANGGGANLPAAGTAITVWMGSEGFQEFDDDVEGTMIRKGNYMVVGTGGSQESLGGDPLPESYSGGWSASNGELDLIEPSAPNWDIGLAVNAPSYWFYFGQLPVAGATVATPSFSPPAGDYEEGQVVTISCATSGATIKYTLDGTVPSESNGIIYTVPIGVSEDLTLRAIAYKTGLNTSSIRTGVYTITPPGGGGGGGSATAGVLTAGRITLG
jgi:hypothetical protein